jgi:hypothetical protein
MSSCEAIIHMRLVDLPKYETDRILDNQSLRVDYLRQQITEDDFKTQIQRLDKKRQKRREMHNVLQMCITAVTDILYRFQDAIKSDTLEEAYGILNEIDQIALYVNECLSDIAVTYNSKAYILNGSLRLRPR